MTLFARPGIDPRFRSAAGLYKIKRRGGTAIIQDPDEAANPGMPSSAMRHVAIDHCAPIAMLPRLIAQAVAGLGGPAELSPQTASEGLEHEMTAEFTEDRPVAITCPDCGGALRQSQLGTLKQFRCHIGHIYTAEVMLDGQFIAMQQSAEAALRSLNERAELCRQMAEQAGPDTASVAEWRQAGDEARDQTDRLRALLDHVWIQPATTLTAGP